MGFLHPELLLLLIPVAALWWWLRGPDRVSKALRGLIALSLVLALAAPYWKTAARGRDLVIVADRSRSMPPGAVAAIDELIRLSGEERRGGDRIAIVGFGAEPAIERLPTEDPRFSGFERQVSADGSDLGQALDTALQLVPDDRPGAVLLVSDGENNGKDPIAAARRAFARGVPIHVRPVTRPPAPDLSIERIELPDTVGAGEPFQFAVWVRADRRGESQFSLERRGTALSSGQRVFEAGLNRLVFRDKLDQGGVVEYRVQVSDAGDRVPENNRAVAAMLVEGTRSLLVVNDDGADDSLVKALRQASLPVEVVAADRARLDPVSLTRHRGVVLENVAVQRLRDGVAGLADFVTERGGGLLVTGGKASFGLGGYYKSAVEEVLPVTMEMRQEHRKLGMALAISLDRSGSMQVPVAAGVRKMDLANLGTCAAVELLSPIDSVAVIAVDSMAHTIVPLQPATDIAGITGLVRQINSMGGGIFCYQALVAAGQAIEDAPQQNKHIILFADANDAEEPGKYIELLGEFEKRGITTSVIGLGKETDKDSEFLRDIAKRGKGECYFCEDANDLPRFFAQDTLTVARTTFIDAPTSTALLPDLYALGDLPATTPPALGGYNLTYLRPGASLGIVTQDEYKAPVVAFLYKGLGRSAVYTGQIGGKFGMPTLQWPGFAGFFTTTARWLLGQEEPQEYFASARRDGKDAVITVEVDPAAKAPVDVSRLTARVREPDGKNRDVVLERTDENRFEGRYPLVREGISLGTVRLAEGRFVTLPPMALPYSPEFERLADPKAGEDLLRRVAEESGGRMQPSASDLFEGERSGRAWRLVTRELMLAATLLLVLEILGRRLALWSMVRVPRAVREIPEKLRARRAAAAAAPAAARPAATRPAATRPAAAPTPGPSAAPSAAPAESKPKETPTPSEPARPSMAEAMARARRAAGKELGR